MTSEPLKTKADFDQDLKTFAELPARTKELLVLKEQAAKATGKERAAVDKVIAEKPSEVAATFRPMVVGPQGLKRRCHSDR